VKGQLGFLENLGAALGLTLSPTVKVRPLNIKGKKENGPYITT